MSDFNEDVDHTNATNSTDAFTPVDLKCKQLHEMHLVLSYNYLIAGSITQNLDIIVQYICFITKVKITIYNRLFFFLSPFRPQIIRDTSGS